MPNAPQPYSMRVIGARKMPLRDFYHALLRLPWRATVALVVVVFLALNAAFAVLYDLSGGVANARPHNFEDAFFFSVETMATIGYGAMHPESRAAHLLVLVESLTGIILTALVTGLVFAKFSRPSARVVFTRQAVICPLNGVPTLTLRLGNERSNQIVDAQITLHLLRTETPAEGGVFYRMHDLTLTRTRALSLQRSWTVQHVIDEKSPLYGLTPQTLAEQEVEVHVLVLGLDDTVMQPVHASHRYFAHEVLWGARHVDILTDTPDEVVLDLRRFHDVEATAPTENFPYSFRTGASLESL